MNPTVTGSVSDLKSVPLSCHEWYALDFSGPFPTTKRGYSHLLILYERFSGFIIAIPTKGTSDTDVMIALIPYVAFFGKQNSIISADNGFKPTVKQFLLSFGIQLRNLQNVFIDIVSAVGEYLSTEHRYPRSSTYPTMLTSAIVCMEGPSEMP
jgi:hypothetical protein